MSETPSAPRAGVELAYDQVADDYVRVITGTDAEDPLDLAMIDRFAALAAEIDDGRILDAGCGAGRITQYLGARGCRLDGLDLSARMLAHARETMPDASWTRGSLTALPFAPKSFSGVLLWYSLIHTPPSQHPAVLAEVARVLRPGGFVLVGFQHGDGVSDLAPVYRRYGHDVELQRYLFTADDLGDSLRTAGLREVARLERCSQEHERDDQAVVLAGKP